MRHNFKKIISMILTVCMLLGTMAMLIPVSASAEQTYPIALEKNKTATINGVTYRFDAASSLHSTCRRDDSSNHKHDINRRRCWFQTKDKSQQRDTKSTHHTKSHTANTCADDDTDQDK